MPDNYPLTNADLAAAVRVNLATLATMVPALAEHPVMLGALAQIAALETRLR